MLEEKFCIYKIFVDYTPIISECSCCKIVIVWDDSGGPEESGYKYCPGCGSKLFYLERMNEMSYVLAGWVFSFVVLIGFDKFVLKNQFTKKNIYTNLLLAALASSVVYFVLAIVGG